MKKDTTYYWKNRFTDLEECRELVGVARVRQTGHHMPYVLQYAPFIQKLKEVIDSGVAGTHCIRNVNQLVSAGIRRTALSGSSWRIPTTVRSP